MRGEGSTLGRGNRITMDNGDGESEDWNWRIKMKRGGTDYEERLKLKAMVGHRSLPQ